VIVVSYRPGEWLRPCLDSVVDQADQVIVVDNASVGGTAARVAGQVGAQVVTANRNLGFAGGVAAGLGPATGDIVAVLNDDAVAGPDWLTSASERLADPTVGAVTPKVRLSGWYREVLLGDEEWFAPGDSRPLGRRLLRLESDGHDVMASAMGAGLHDLESAGGEQWRWTRPGRPFYVPVGGPSAELRVDGDDPGPGATVRLLNHAGSWLRAHGVAGEIGFGTPDDGRFDEPTEPFGFSGTAPVFRTETLHRIGAFAPRFFAYNEDTDWCLRARLTGLRVVYDPTPGAAVDHRMSATSGGTGSAMVRRLAQRNALLCMARNAPLSVVRPEVVGRLRRLPGDVVARQLAQMLPWALATRVRMSRMWTEDPVEVWSRWAEQGGTWDTSPARS
jgi:hypothetical protein